MAGPTIQHMLAQTGVTQTVQPKKTDDTKKESENRQLPAGGDDDEDSKKTGGAGAKATKAGSTSTGQEGGKRVRRKKVSLDQLGSKQTEKTSKKESTSNVSKQSETQAASKAQSQNDTSDTKALGYAKAASKLNEQSKMVQASVQHEQSLKDSPLPELSQTGRKRAMLNSLVNMTGINHAQHTGDKAGEAYNRRGAREAHMCLKGMRDGNLATGSSSSSSSSTTDRLSSTGVKYDQHKLQNVQTFYAEEQPAEPGYEAFEATG